MSRATMTAMTLVEIPITQATVASSIGHSWIARARFSSASGGKQVALSFERGERRVCTNRLVCLGIQLTRKGELVGFHLRHPAVQTE